MLKAVVFDADNTLYESRKAAKKADLIIMKKLSKLIKKPKEKCYKEFMDIVKKVKDSKFPYYRTRRYSYSLLLRKYGIINPDLVERVYNLFEKNEIKNTKLYPEVLFMLKELKKKYKLYLFTEGFKEFVDKKLKKFKLKKYFSKIITSNETGLMKSAGVVAYKKFLKLTGLNPKNMIYVGDSVTKDIITAEKLGIKAVLIDRDNKEDFNGLKISNLKELLKVV